jgi:hypothetical protein
MEESEMRGGGGGGKTLASSDPAGRAVTDEASEVLGRDPRFVVLVPRFAIDERIHGDPSFAARYRLVLSVNHRFNWTPPSSYELHLFERVAP